MGSLMKLTRGQILGCCIAGPIVGLIVARDPWRVWTDPLADMLGGFLVVVFLVFVAKIVSNIGRRQKKI